MKINHLILPVLLLFLQSCVPYKDIIYVQGSENGNTVDAVTYKVQKNDILYIDLKSSDDNINSLFTGQSGSNTSNLVNATTLYFNGYTVDKNGYIDIPLVRKIKVEGKTFKEIKNIIKQKLLETQLTQSADVFIKVKLAGVPYTVIGEVQSPQTGVLYKSNPTVFDVLGDAKDITAVGNRHEVIVLRTENNRPTKHLLDLTKADVVQSPYFYVRPNDIIYVKPLKQKVWGTGTTLQQTISTTITALSLITTIILLSTYAN